MSWTFSSFAKYMVNHNFLKLQIINIASHLTLWIQFNNCQVVNLLAPWRFAKLLININFIRNMSRCLGFFHHLPSIWSIMISLNYKFTHCASYQSWPPWTFTNLLRPLELLLSIWSNIDQLVNNILTQQLSITNLLSSWLILTFWVIATLIVTC